MGIRVRMDSIKVMVPVVSNRMYVTVNEKFIIE